MEVGWGNLNSVVSSGMLKVTCLVCDLLLIVVTTLTEAVGALLGTLNVRVPGQ